jgi:hypothetical protein
MVTLFSILAGLYTYRDRVRWTRSRGLPNVSRSTGAASWGGGIQDAACGRGRRRGPEGLEAGHLSPMP